jgi:hypothetical protein
MSAVRRNAKSRRAGKRSLPDFVRLLGTPTGAYLLSKLKTEAQVKWGSAVLGVNEINDGAQIGFYFQTGTQPTQASVDALMAAHDPTPVASVLSPAEQTVRAFMRAASGSATDTQRDNVVKAIVRFIRGADLD